MLGYPRDSPFKFGDDRPTLLVRGLPVSDREPLRCRLGPDRVRAKERWESCALSGIDDGQDFGPPFPSSLRYPAVPYFVPPNAGRKGRGR